MISPHDPGQTNVSLKLKPPSSHHYLGTDELGRDVLSRMLHGSRISLTVGFIAVGISILIGVFVGAVAGYYRSWVDSLLMRFVDTMLCFPSFFLILTVVALMGPAINIMIVIGITSWMGTARFVRAEFLSLRERDFVQAARSPRGQGPPDHLSISCRMRWLPFLLPRHSVSAGHSGGSGSPVSWASVFSPLLRAGEIF